MNSIEKRLKEGLAQASAKFKDDADVERYVRISNEFDELVKLGLAQKRGNNLLSLSDKAAQHKLILKSM
ncbi:MAG: hypothetical protein HLUCCA01_12620 [Bacteroidetes bacterium HLUCCA01]|nr:MAG: hypothetical protein HLUCCA01_12620 [Bacteroidetes bacterium HLUCCA01]